MVYIFYRAVASIISQSLLVLSAPPDFTLSDPTFCDARYYVLSRHQRGFNSPLPFWRVMANYKTLKV